MRRILCFLTAVLLLGALCIPVSAATGATGARVDAILNADGTSTVSVSLNLRVEEEGEIRFAVPGNARGITLNGYGASTRKDGEVLSVDLGRITGDMPGTYSIVIRYTVPNTVSYTEAGEPQLTMPLLSGFAHPIEELYFSVILPEPVKFTPHFLSGYRQQSIETEIIYEVQGSQITGTVQSAMKDRETLSLNLQLTQATFPRSAVEPWSAGVADIITFVFMGLAALYWLIFLRCAPHLRKPNLQPPEGSTAGEMRCALIGQGADLTMMVMSWAQMGYVLIHLKQNGRVTLYKRMDMGNERGVFENKVFRSLFGKKNSVDGSSLHYARLYRQVALSRASVQDMFRKQSGNPKVLRILGAAAGVFGGASLAIGLAGNALLAVVIIFIMSVAGAVASWLMQNWVEGLHLRFKGSLILGLALAGIWLALGIMADSLGMASAVVGFQLLLGLANAYGGRRTPSGRAVTARILGLRGCLRKMPREELERVRRSDSDYFFDMVPYALALGVDKAFAAQFGRQRLSPCPWLTTGMDGHMTAQEWAQVMRKAASSLDERQKRLTLERLTGRTI